MKIAALSLASASAGNWPEVKAYYNFRLKGTSVEQEKVSYEYRFDSDGDRMERTLFSPQSEYHEMLDFKLQRENLWGSNTSGSYCGYYDFDASFQALVSVRSILDNRYNEGGLTTFDGTVTFPDDNRAYYSFTTQQLNDEY